MARAVNEKLLHINRLQFVAMILESKSFRRSLKDRWPAYAIWDVLSDAQREELSRLDREWQRARAGRPEGPVDPSWLAWNNGTVLKMAQAIAADRTFEDLPILADALEEAGCTDAHILAHCRRPGKHRRDCWVTNLLLKMGTPGPLA